MKRETRHKYQEEILEICRKKHLTAEEILNKLKIKNKEVGQATVYRTIKKLSENNLLNIISGSDNKNHYEKNEEMHGHFVDEKDNIIDFDISEEFKKEIEKKVGKKIKRMDLKVYV